MRHYPSQSPSGYKSRTDKHNHYRSSSRRRPRRSRSGRGRRRNERFPYYYSRGRPVGIGMSFNKSKRLPLRRGERLSSGYSHDEERERESRRFKYETLTHCQSSSRHGGHHVHQQHHHRHSHKHHHRHHHHHREHDLVHGHVHRSRVKGEVRMSTRVKDRARSRSPRRYKHHHEATASYSRKEEGYPISHQSRSCSSRNASSSNNTYERTSTVAVRPKRHQLRNYDGHGRWNDDKQEHEKYQHHPHRNQYYQHHHHHHHHHPHHRSTDVHHSRGGKYVQERKSTAYWRDVIRGIKVEREDGVVVKEERNDDPRDVKVERESMTPPPHNRHRSRSPSRTPVNLKMTGERARAHERSPQRTFHDLEEGETERREHNNIQRCPLPLMNIKLEIEDGQVVVARHNELSTANEENKEPLTLRDIKVEAPPTPKAASDSDSFRHDDNNNKMEDDDCGMEENENDAPQTMTFAVFKNEIMNTSDHSEGEIEDYPMTPASFPYVPKTPKSPAPPASNFEEDNEGIDRHVGNDFNPIVAPRQPLTVAVIKQELIEDCSTQNENWAQSPVVTINYAPDPRLEKRRLNSPPVATLNYAPDPRVETGNVETGAMEINPRDPRLNKRPVDPPKKPEKTFMAKIIEEPSCTGLGFLESPFVNKVVPKRRKLPRKPLDRPIEEVISMYPNAVALHGVDRVLDIYLIDDQALEQKEAEFMQQKDSNGWTIPHEGTIAAKKRREQIARRRQLYKECEKHYGKGLRARMVSEEIAIARAVRMGMEEPMNGYDEIRILERILDDAIRYPGRVALNSAHFYT